jgi:hypothetical protein
MVGSLPLGLAIAASCTSSGVSNGGAGQDASNDASAGQLSTMDGSASDAEQVDVSSDAPAACNSLANLPPAVTIAEVASDPPPASGGVIVDGTYSLWDVTIFTGPRGAIGSAGSTQTTIQIQGNTVQVVSTAPPTTRTLTLVTNGTSFTATDTCPDATVIQGSYSVNLIPGEPGVAVTQLVVQFAGGTDEGGARTVQQTFTKH